jgi:hypothetical protein
LNFIRASLLGAIIATSGCSMHQAAQDPSIRQSLTPAVAAFDSGMPREGLGDLLGKPVDDTTWNHVAQNMLARRNEQAAHQADECARNVALLSEAIELYRADSEGRLPDKLSDVLDVANLKAMPTCPTSGSDTYSAGYVHKPGSDTFQLCCHGSNHTAAGLAVNQPSYDARWGVVSEPARSTTQSAATWWPGNYRLEVVSVEALPDRALVKLRETSPAGRHDVSVALVPKGNAWVLGPQEASSAVDSPLLALLESYRRPATAVSNNAPVENGRAQCERSMRRVATALEMYSSDHNGAYPTRLSDLVPKYMRGLPACPTDGSGAPPDYSLHGDTYELTCHGTHSDVRVSNRPLEGRSVGRSTGQAAPAMYAVER